jgi:signal transduction histidine kinase/ligand-binding sensor domain-containing protein
MQSRSPRSLLDWAFVGSVCLLLAVLAARAEKLPIKLYTSADGLASSAITHVARDSLGFLWFSNRDGLSRFDGTEFVNYRLPESATSQTFRYFLETSDGWIWLATDDGLYRTRRSDVADVKPHPGTDVRDRILDVTKVWDGFTYVLFEDSGGTMWIGGSKLYRVDERNGEQITVTTIETPHTDLTHTFWITEAPDKSIWLSQLQGPLRILPDGRQIFYPIDRAAPGDEVYAIAVDNEGRVWFGQSGGLYVFRPETKDDLLNIPTVSSRPMNLTSVAIDSGGAVAFPLRPGELLRITYAPATAVFRDQDRICAAMGTSLFLFEGETYRRVGGPNVLTGTTRSITADAQHSLWLGSTGGVIQFIQDGFATYGAEDGLTDPQISSIFESPGGDLMIAHGLWRISRLTEKGFESAVLNVPRDVRHTWTSAAVAADREGSLYALAREGVFRFASDGDVQGLAERKPDVFPEHAGKPFYRAFTGRDGKVWFSLRGLREQNGLLRFDPRTGVFEDMTRVPGFPKGKSPASFAEDKGGNIWMGFYAATGLLRYAAGEFREFNLSPENTRGTLALLVDRKGRLWAGSASHGIKRIIDPTAEPFVVEVVTEANGLASNNVRAMTDDEAGNVYVGTVRGVDRISLETDSIRHFSTDDGLAADFINTAYRDRHGALWFGTPNGLSKLAPPKDEKPEPPVVFINELQIAGETYGISGFGQTTVERLDLTSSQNNLQIGVVGIGSKILYQYRLDGSGNEDWSRAATNRTFNFANLAAGNYTFLVRAIAAGGVASDQAARVSFVINPPFYRTWWFYGVVALVVLGSVVALDRYRVSKTRQIQIAYDDLRRSEDERRLAEAALERSREERLAELERVRTRIATDLHDDIGSSLTQIAVLSQAAHSQAEHAGNSNPAPLQRISDVSIELVNAMSDIVWAINPRRDNVRDLVQRMRRFASDVFTAKGIRFEFRAPATESKVPIGANIRREVFAIFKEAVNNVVRHSGAERAGIKLEIDDEKLTIEISDGGKGFDAETLMHMSQPPDTSGGNGLINMGRRASELGGHCEIISQPGQGTVVKLDVPLAGPYSPEENGGAPASRVAGENTRVKP